MHDEGIGPIWGGIWKIYTFGQLDSYLFSFLFAYEHIYLQHIYLKIQKNMMVITDFEIFYFTSSTKMEHELKLNSLCRLWGVKIPINSKSHSKESFKSAITSLYNIDIDSLNIHPSKICTSCRLRLTRYCSQTQDATWINLPVLHEFLPHSDNCDICYVKPGRQKKVLKRNLSVPSQSTKKSFIIFVKNIHITAWRKTVKTDQDLWHPPTVHHLQHHPLLPIIHHVRQHAPFLSLKIAVIWSIPIEWFCHVEVAQSFMSLICRGVPCEPYISKCNIFFAKNA